MTKKLYVGNLSYESTEQELRDLFSQAGEIADLALISDRSTGQSKGFAFLTMATDEGTEAAITRFNGHSLGNRELVIDVARPRENTGGSRSRY